VDPAQPPIMGRASPVVRVRLSKFPANFDVVDNLRRLFETAYSLNFHLGLSDATRLGLLAGKPILVTEIGVGSMQRQASSLAAFVSVPLIGSLAKDAPSSAYKPDPVTKEYPEMPWQNGQVQRQSARLANTVASALLEAGSDKIGEFQQIMQGTPLPRGTVTSDLFVGTDTIEKLCRTLTTTTNSGSATNDNLANVQAYQYAFNDAIFRKNILYAIQFVTTLTLGGVPPDWVKVSLLRDIVPWSGQFLYEMLAKIQALVDAYRGVMDEIKDFIDLLIRKIDTMERFVEYLISLLNYIESLEVGCYVLAVPESSGGVQDWSKAIDEATGNKPSMAVGGFSAGVALAYVYPDLSPLGPAIAKAWNLIF
jgi:hypothetical protein